jgi:predicted nucleic acid-binding protein
MSDDFFDTNVLTCLLSAGAKKADRAEALVRQGGAISVQVLNQAANVARRKLAMDWRDTRAFLASLRGLLTVAPLTAETHALGLDFAERHKLSITDAMIAAAATLAGCARLWSQDMQDGMKIGERLRAADPFRRAEGRSPCTDFTLVPSQYRYQSGH